MITFRMKDGVTFDPTEAIITITPKGSETLYSWEDLALMGLIDVSFDVMRGVFGPAKMPIRGIRFNDPSDLQIEVPMPLEIATEMGKMLQETKVEVVKHLPASLLFRDRLDG